MPAAIMNKMGSDSTRNEHVETRVCLINFDGSSVKVTLFSSLKIMRVGRIFTRGEIVDFFQGVQSGAISFYFLQTKKTTFFDENLTGKCQIWNSRRRLKLPLSPLPAPMRKMFLF